jgi:hypothetical protein
LAIVSIPKEAELQPYAPSGRYTNGDHGAKIIGAEVSPMPGKEKDGTPRTGTYLNVRVMFRSPDGITVFAGTSPFGRHNTQLAKASASKAARFVRQLGFDPDAFDPAQLEGMPVTFDTDLETYTSGGDERKRNTITDIYKG